MEDLLHHTLHFKGETYPWVVLVHGAGGSVRTFKYQVEDLSEHFNLLLVDLRDHGNSHSLPPPPHGRYDFRLMASDVVNVMQTRGISQAHFLGVSMGSIVVRWIQETQPSLVQSMVFAGGVFRLNWKLKWGIRIGWVLAHLVSFRLLSRIISWLIMPRGNHQRARKIFLREADRIAPHALKKWLGMSKTIGKELEYFFQKAPEVPCLSVMGSQDHAFLPQAIAFQRRYPEIELKIMQGRGHVCNIEASGTFNRYAIEFIEKKPIFTHGQHSICK